MKIKKTEKDSTCIAPRRRRMPSFCPRLLPLFGNLIILSLIVAATFNSACAQISLSPSLQEVKVQRGYAKTFAINLRNLGDFDAPSKFGVFDMVLSPEGTPMIADSGYARGGSRFIILDTYETTIKAHELFVLTGTITVPKDAAGGYYSLIKGTFEENKIPMQGPKDDIAKESQIMIINEAATALLISVASGNSKSKLIPDSLEIHLNQDKAPGSIFNSSPSETWKIILPIHNDGNIHTQVTGLMSLWTETGYKIASCPLTSGQGYIFPGLIRNFSASGTQIVTDGYYLVRIFLRTIEGRTWSNSYPFSVYRGKVYPGQISEDLSALLEASSPGFSLSKTFIEKTIAPRGHSFITVPLMSSRDDTLIVFPKIYDWKLGDDGLAMIGHGSDFQPRSCSAWLSLMQDSVVLMPRGKSMMKLEIAAPQEISGEYYSALVFNLNRNAKDLPEEFTALRTQLLAVKSAADLIYDVEIDSILVESATKAGVTANRLIIIIKNNGNVHCFASGYIDFEKEVAKNVFKAEGQPIKFGSDDLFVLPAGYRRFHVNILDREPGNYRIMAVVNYKQQGDPVRRYQRVKFK